MPDVGIEGKFHTNRLQDSFTHSTSTAGIYGSMSPLLLNAMTSHVFHNPNEYSLTL